MLRLLLVLLLTLGLGRVLGGDLMDLARRRHIYHVIGLHLNLVARRQEGVEAHDEVGVPLEELRNTANHAGGVDALRLELLHDI